MQTKVIYNDSCPICSREIDAYRKYSEAQDLPLTFAPLSTGAPDSAGLTPDEAARRLHVVQGDVVLAGLPAFVALWSEMPRFRWLAWLVSRPVIRPVADLVYEWVLAPILYSLHKRRIRRAVPEGDCSPNVQPDRDDKVSVHR